MFDTLAGDLIVVCVVLILLIPALVLAIRRGRNQNLKPPEE